MTFILAYLWTLLTDLPAAMRPRSPAKVRPIRAEAAAETRVRTPARRPRQASAPPMADAAAIERALAELMALYAQWQAGTLPPPASRYHPHPSWQPVQLRRPAAPALPARAPATSRATPRRRHPPAAALPTTDRCKGTARPHPPAPPPARPPLPQSRIHAASPCRRARPPRPPNAHRSQAPTPTTCYLFRLQIIPYLSLRSPATPWNHVRKRAPCPRPRNHAECT